MPPLGWSSNSQGPSDRTSIPYHTRLQIVSRESSPARSTSGARTINVPLTPTYFAQASAYHDNSLGSPVHSRKPSKAVEERGRRFIEHDQSIATSSDMLSPLSRDFRHERRRSSRKSLTIKPPLQIRTKSDRPDPAKVFQTLLSAPPMRHVIYSALSPFSLPRESEETDLSGDEDLETGEAFEPYTSKIVGRNPSVGQKLLKAWPWEWRPPGMNDFSQGGEEYEKLDDDGQLPTMVPRPWKPNTERRLLTLFVGLLATAVTLQLAIILGIGGFG